MTTHLLVDLMPPIQRLVVRSSTAPLAGGNGSIPPSTPPVALAEREPEHNEQWLLDLFARPTAEEPALDSERVQLIFDQFMARSEDCDLQGGHVSC